MASRIVAGLLLFHGIAGCGKECEFEIIRTANPAAGSQLVDGVSSSFDSEVGYWADGDDTDHQSMTYYIRADSAPLDLLYRFRSDWKPGVFSNPLGYASITLCNSDIRAYCEEIWSVDADATTTIHAFTPQEAETFYDGAPVTYRAFDIVGAVELTAVSPAGQLEATIEFELDEDLAKGACRPCNNGLEGCTY